MPLQATSGAASYDAFGGGVAAVPQYIEDVFSTYLVTGDGTAPAVNNGIDLSTKGGLVWTKKRSAAGSHSLFDTARGANLRLISNDTAAQDSVNLSFTTTGFSNYTFDSGVTYASWTFRKQPKFFDVVTFSGTGSAQTIAHNLGSVPGCIIVKNLDALTNWAVYHRSLGGTYITRLNRDWASDTGYENWANTDPTSTVFTVGNGNATNGSGYNYVAYVFAHNAGGFGLTGTDNVISCGSYTGTGATGNVITLGYEPQFVLVKRTDTADNWVTMDAMRGGFLRPNTSEAELGGTGWFNVSGDNLFPTATGFQVNTAGAAWNASGGTYIYIAIRRGPMKVPTSGTSVFTTRVATEVEYNNTADFGITTDLLLNRYYKDGSQYTMSFDRLRGSSKILYTPLTDAEGSLTLGAGNLGFGAAQTSVTWAQIANSSVSNVTWAFRRAPSFFDEVCYTGTGANPTNFNHNLGAVPELMILKKRSNTDRWEVYSAALGNTKRIDLNTDGAATTVSIWGGTPTTTQFSLTDNANVNQSGQTYVAYLFATCAGVSKVGSYTGTATTKQVDCGFTGGARFVLIKRTDSTGDWYVWDSARGIVSGNDPYLLLNSTAAEVTSTDYIDTYSAGFEISSTAPAAINASGGTFIFLAIA